MVTPDDGRRRRACVRVCSLLVVGLLAFAGCTSDRERDDARDAGPSTSIATSTTTPTTVVRPARSVPKHVVRANPRDDVFAFGAGFHGSTARQSLGAPIVDIAATPAGGGYWLLGADGGVFSFGDARFYGAAPRSSGTYVGIAATRTGRGYWLATRTGLVRSFGDASAARPKSSPRGDVVAIETTPSGRGFWLAAADGTVFGTGDAKSAPKPPHLNQPVVAIAAARPGYVLAARDGGTFALGGAPFAGSAADESLRAPIVDIASVPNGRGYWLVGADGGAFSFGTPYVGSAARVGLGAKRVVAAAAHPNGAGFWMARGERQAAPVVRPAVVPPRSSVAPRGPSDAPPPTAPQSAPHSVPPRPPSPAPAGGVLGIGDSVMLGAAGALRNAISGIAVDAVVSRQFANLPGILAGYRDRGALPGTIIVHLGTNGTVSSGDIDAAMQIAAGRRVVFVNVWVPRSWEAQSNAAIAAGVGRWGNAGLGDWRSIAARGGMVAGDGYHMTSAGAAAYAAMLQSAVG